VTPNIYKKVSRFVKMKTGNIILPTSEDWINGG